MEKRVTHDASHRSTDGTIPDLSRRAFIGGALALLLAGCAGDKPTMSDAPTIYPQPSITTPARPISEASIGSDEFDWSGLSLARSPELRKLAGYKEIFDGKPPDSIMTFTTDGGWNTIIANKTAAEISKNRMTPLVIMEPNLARSGLTLAEYIKAQTTPEGQKQLEKFFTELKSRVDSKAYNGVYVYAPEMNIPAFGPVLKPEELAEYVAASIKTQKELLPSSLAAVMFDSTTYPPRNTDWSRPDRSATALVPYANALRAEAEKQGVTIDVLGFQGYPWGKDAEAKDYLPAQMAINAAKAAGISNVVINTGTASETIDPDTGKIFKTTLQQRKEQLYGVLEQAKVIQKAGLKVGIVLFAEDKHATEANWAYQNPEELALLQDFVRKIRAAGFDFTFFAGE